MTGKDYLRAIRKKTVVSVAADEHHLGWNATFTCGHTVFFPVPVSPGDRMHCGACLHNAVPPHEDGTKS